MDLFEKAALKLSILAISRIFGWRLFQSLRMVRWKKQKQNKTKKKTIFIYSNTCTETV